MLSFAYFPTIIYRDECPELVEKILPKCIHYLNQVRNSDSTMCQSNDLKNDLTFKEVSEYIVGSVTKLLEEQGYITNQYDFYLSSLWAQELGFGSSTNVHVHKNSQMCGWIFLETPQGGSYPIYHDTRTNKSMIELDYKQETEIKNATSYIHFNNMQPGTVMFSNSWMQHQLTRNNVNVPTRCIHFVVSHKDRLCNIY